MTATETKDHPPEPLVSVIVPVRNGREYIDALLRALSGQTMPIHMFEVVIGDDGSTDGTTDGLEDRDANIRVVRGQSRNAYAARNRAVESARGSILAFCDADCVPDAQWLEAGVEALRGADIVAGRITFSVPARRTTWTLLDIDGTKNHELQVAQGVGETANLFLTRGVFDRVGGFDESLPAYGDFDFVERCVAAGAKLVYAVRASVSHPTRDSGRRYLGSVWFYNRWYAAREAREGRVPEGIWLRSWVPLLETIRGRRRWGLSLLGPDRRWLAENGVEPSARETAISLPLMYVVVPYVRLAAQLRGWVDGRRLRRAGAR